MAISRDSLLTLEAYAKARAAMRARIIEHKKTRRVHLGEHLTVLFEDEATIRYQIQEMLHIEKIFEEHEIQNELETYSPLTPDGDNLKATLQIEYENETERRLALTRLIGIAQRVFIRVDGEIAVYAIADEDLERENNEKTSAVHFIRFELTPQMKSKLRQGAGLSMGCDHPHYPVPAQAIAPAIRASLINDLA